MRDQVLLVDDDEFARCFARSVLEQAGFEVWEAVDLAEAIRAVNSALPTAVVTDWNLPDGNGGALAQRVHEQAEGLPIILVTGDHAAKSLSDTCAFTAILYKPYPPSALERAIRAAIE
jgi:DNA-binding response OmpR family regulator